MMTPKAAKTRFSFEAVCPYLYILPSLLLFSLFVFYPFARTLHLSLSLTAQAGSVIGFVGLDSFKAVLVGASARDFWFSMGVTLKYAAMVVSGSIVLGLVCAILANEAFVGRGLVRTVFAMPMSISSACIAVIGVFALNPTMGIVNSLLNISLAEGLNHISSDNQRRNTGNTNFFRQRRGIRHCLSNFFRIHISLHFFQIDAGLNSKLINFGLGKLSGIVHTILIAFLSIPLLGSSIQSLSRILVSIETLALERKEQ